MQNPKQIITENLKQWQEKNSAQGKFEVSISQNLTYGDLATNIALVTKIENKSPRQLADELILEIGNWNLEILDRVEVAGPGFINFYLSNQHLSQVLQEITQNESAFGRSNNNSGQKVIVEFGDPNPFKEIHIGHLRNFCIGESFSRLLESQGNSVTRANYQGDVGMHVAKSLWAILRTIDKGQLTIDDLKPEILAKSYAEGATEFENNEEAKKEIIVINKKVYELVSHSELREESRSFTGVQDDNLKQLWEEGRKVSLDSFEAIYKRVGVHYDKYYFESVTAKRGKELVSQHIDDGIFERHDGAVVYRGENEGLHTRVFLTSQDYATYEGKDLALAVIKNEDEPYDESVILTGNEQLEYFQVMLAALKKIAPELAEKTKHHTFGHVRLKEGKMSSRTGDVITASLLLDEAVNKVKTAFPEMDQETAEKVGVGAVKYSMLKFSIPSDIHFSFDESINLEGNSGPYLLYSFVRTQSVLAKAGFESSRFSIPNSQLVINDQLDNENLMKIENWKLEIEESELLRFLSQYPYHLEQAAAEFAPNLLCNYLFDLAQKFNNFYQKHKIIGTEQELFRLHLTKAVGEVLKSGLQTLGIETVEKM